jgi:type VI secretion system protein ImpM
MPRPVSAGFYGKLPARGDFVRAGLPRTFVEPWDAWLGAVLAGSRALMGESWLGAWLEAPVWRFSLARGTSGPDAALGLMLPSVDRVGRYFPLTFAAVFDGGGAPPEQSACDAWLDRCEAAGRAALDGDAVPERIAALLPPLVGYDCAAAGGGNRWWTEGSPRVDATRLQLADLPDAGTFATMLDGAVPTTQE